MQVVIYGATIYLIFSLIRIIYQVIIGFLYVNPETNNRVGNYNPLVSVIIPAWNEQVGIKNTIRSIMAGSYKNIEIIVVDDGSTDNTYAVVEKLRRRYYKNGSKINILSIANGGKANALNTGISIATGSIILTVDADSFLTKYSIKHLVAALADDRYSVAIGEVIVGNKSTLIGKIQHYEYLIGFHFKRTQHVMKSTYIFPGALTAFRTEVLREVGKFETYSSTEDLDISMKIKSKGYQIAYVDNATCLTEGASTIGGLLNQRTRWRHGYLECMLRRNDFVWSTSKGKYLTWIELPLSIVGVFEVLLYPAILGFMIYQVLANPYLPVFIMSYLMLPFIFFLLIKMRDETAAFSLKEALIMPVALSVVNIVEFVALNRSIYRTIRRKKTAWTVWSRTGASG